MSKVHHSFDLFDYINTVMSPEVAAQMASSVAFRVDVMVIGAARQLYKDIRGELYSAGVDQMAELTLALNMQAYAETAFYENGSTTTGPVSTIKELMFQRQAWHGLAKQLTELTCDWKGVPKTYIERSIEDMIFEPGQMKVANETKARLKTSTQRRAEAMDMPEAAETLYQKRLARSEANATNTMENMKTMAQGVAHMFSLAVAHPMEDPSGETTMEFGSLSLETQRVLINAANAAASKAEEWAAENRSLSDADFDMISLSQIKVDKDLRAQLKQPRFVAQAAQQQAAEKNLG